MIQALVIGRTRATMKHPSMEGQRMLVVQTLDANDQKSGDPMVVLDAVGAGVGDRVVITSDGRFAREFLESSVTPVRWVVMGLVDSVLA